MLKLNDSTIQLVILETIYPVGSIYMSVNETPPSEIIGGEWEQIEDKFLLAGGKQFAAGSVGGEASHTLTVDEMAKHSHNDGTDDTRVFTVATGGSGTSAVVVSNAAAGTRNTTETGGNQPHNNMPPYLAVYMWKRIK